MKRVFGVIGLGRFGYNVAKTLAESGAEVIACDIDEDKVRQVADIVHHSFILDATDEKALKESGIANADTVIVSIGENIEASILVVVQLMELGVKEIIAKAVNPLHGRILERLGVKRVIHPERDMAIRLAHSLLVGGFIEEIPIADNYSIFEVIAPKGLHHKTLKALDLRKKHDITVLAIKRGERFIVNPSGDEEILPEDILVVLGRREKIGSL
ncbi:MAG: TrkA family potassium uptake protein [Aquificaceae bacterium]|nr:TrkA family potassium uptake protein [Aquificaceae bacterium]MCS7278106.1 TrkA family potassium uptake protein [Aquificaceae bacterium]MCS7278169.1 TrkA family potassium uptake protein [Aquificaceae bacterium]MDW8066866.1 TrkA family potassium uptake protein [Aquificaceae bacterium]MDW8423855.1 TrkA family potassium uptake protein [Aquificaceae bacterium]